MSKIIECVPNFSEGRSVEIINQITSEIERVKNVKLLDVDMGYDTNRTVVTFAGSPDSVAHAAFKAIQKASILIDMSTHKGEHARMGATDVCPIIPVANVSMDECVKISRDLAKKVGAELNIPVYLYEYSANKDYRKNLANIRSGEYEGFKNKIKDKKWIPDYGPSIFNSKSGVTAIGVRDFLIAFNVNLNTSNKKIASDIALDIREQGRAKRDCDNKILRDSKGAIIKIPGTLKNVKAVGWYIDEYNQAQVSMNLINYKKTSMHEAFDEVVRQASKRGLRVTGSEIVGLLPKEAILDSGKYFLKKQNSSIGIPDKDIILSAIQSLGLNDLSVFDSKKSIIEEALNINEKTFKDLSVSEFVDEVSRKTPTPGGGSVSALAGSLSASLLLMTINLSYNEKMEDYGVNISKIKYNLLSLVDKDSEAFDKVMTAFTLPKKNDLDKKNRNEAIQNAYKNAVVTPMLILEEASKILIAIKKIYKLINQNCLSDLGVSVELSSSSIKGAVMNIRINLSEIEDKIYVEETNKKVDSILSNVNSLLSYLNKNIII